MTDKPIVYSAGSAAPRILTIRGQKVILDADLAVVYGVPTKHLNEQVKRNADRFPSDFLFRLTAQETRDLITQFAISSAQHAVMQQDAPNWSHNATGSRKPEERQAIMIGWNVAPEARAYAEQVMKMGEAKPIQFIKLRFWPLAGDESKGHVMRKHDKYKHPFSGRHFFHDAGLSAFAGRSGKTRARADSRETQPSNI